LHSNNLSPTSDMTNLGEEKTSIL